MVLAKDMSLWNRLSLDGYLGSVNYLQGSKTEDAEEQTVVRVVECAGILGRGGTFPLHPC